MSYERAIVSEKTSVCERAMESEKTIGKERAGDNTRPLFWHDTCLTLLVVCGKINIEIGRTPYRSCPAYWP